MIKKHQISNLVAVLVLCHVLLMGSVSAMNIDVAHKYAWGENIGWINFGSVEGDVDVSATAMDGYAWGENIGWISLTCRNTASCGTVDYGIIISGSTVAGYAWGENVGWISFNCSNTSSCDTVDYSVSLNTVTGDFSGHAWGENIGWIVFNCTTTNSCGTVDYKLRTTAVLVGPVGGSGGTLPPSPPISTPTPALTPTPTDTQRPTPTPSLSTSPLPTIQGTPPPIGPTRPPPSGTPVSPPSGGGGGGGGTVPVFIGKIADFIIRAMSNPNIIFEKAQELSRRLLEAIPGHEQTTQSVVIGGAAITITQIVAFMITAFTGLADLLLYALFLWIGLLEFLGLIRRVPHLGTVYDAQTKKPLAYAKVELLDQSLRTIEMRVTDGQGRYGFIISASSSQETERSFTLKASKPGYRFPSQLVANNPDGIYYEHVYPNRLQKVPVGSIVYFDIPLDPVVMRPIVALPLPSLRYAFWRAITGTFLLWVGTTLALIQFLARGGLLHAALLAGMVIIGFLRLLGFKQKPFGLVRDVLMPKFAVPYSFITLEDETGTRAGFSVSDEHGRYLLVVKPGGYTLSAATPGNIQPGRRIQHRVVSKRGLIKEQVDL